MHRPNALLAMTGLAAILAAPRFAACQETTPLVTGRTLSPQGIQTNVGSFPANALLSPDGRYIVVTNTGFREFVSVLRVSDGKLISQFGANDERTDGSKGKSGLYYGLAFGQAAGGKTPLYVSRGAEDRVTVLSLDGDGVLTDTGQSLDDHSGVPDGKSPHHVAGLAMNRDATRLYAVNNNTSVYTGQKGSLSVLDVATNKILKTIDLPGFPYAIAAITTGPNADKRLFVTSERDGVVSVVDLESGRVSKDLKTGMQPVGLLLSADQKTLFVANAGSDTVSVIDTASERVVTTILLRPDSVRGLPGVTPIGLALSPDEKTLYVTLADMNAVGVVSLPKGDLVGMIPVGWYPTSVVAAPDGRHLFVANAKGVNARNPNGKPVGSDGKLGQYIQNIIEGTVSLLDLPGTVGLKQLTTEAMTNSRVRPVTPADDKKLLPETGIEHVIYIVKENRTYDQVLGDLPQGNGDPKLCLFPREVTPNLHALAERFVLLDNFYCCAEVSADGWQWSIAGMTSEYSARNVPFNYSGRGRNYDQEGQNNGVAVDLLGIPDVARPPSGYIWDACRKKGVSYRNYGFYVSFADKDTVGPDGKPLAIDNAPNKKALVGKTDVNFRYFDLNYADSDAWVTYGSPAPTQDKSYGKFKSPSRFSEWKREFDDYVKNDNLPKFEMVRLMRDHTNGTATGMNTPRAMVADNDYAVGELVEAVSKSPYWKKTAIFVVEDDAQNGYDHVDAHRSIAFVISPCIRKGSVDSRFYNTDSLLRTMELLLGLPPMSQYDAGAPPIAAFAALPDNDAPYSAILPPKSLIGEVNTKTAYRAKDSKRLIDPLKADDTPDEIMNDILWHAIKGVNTPAPAIRHNGIRALSAARKRDADDD